MNFLIEHQYVILYFSGAFFSFFAMISYIKFGNSFVGGKKKLDSPEDFFGDFDNDDLEALLDESFDVNSADENLGKPIEEISKAADAKETAMGDYSFLGQNLEIENKVENKIQNNKSNPSSKSSKHFSEKGGRS
jgi:hypothetical protein